MEENCIAFKLNYCSGGANANCIGFRGICNDEIMKQNVRVLRRGWCSHVDYLCKQLLSKKISPEECRGGLGRRASTSMQNRQ